MKKAILLFAIGTIAFSCKKKKDDPQPVVQTPAPTPTPSTLELTLVDAIGNRVTNSEVNIYKTRTEWLAAIEELKTSNRIYTGDKSSFKFDITQDGYYILAVSNGCLNNVFGGVRISELEPNVAHKETVVLSTVSKLKITNNRTASVNVLKDSETYLTRPALSDTIVLLPSGTYKFTVNGSSVDKTVSCGTLPVLTIN